MCSLFSVPCLKYENDRQRGPRFVMLKPSGLLELYLSSDCPSAHEARLKTIGISISYIRQSQNTTVCIFQMIYCTVVAGTWCFAGFCFNMELGRISYIGTKPIYRSSGHCMEYWHTEAEIKWPPFCRRYFRFHCLECNLIFNGPINNNPTLVKIMVWRNKLLSEQCNVLSMIA